MKYIFVLIVFMHSIIHLLGFIKGFGIKEIKELSMFISKYTGILWLLVSILFIIYTILFLKDFKNSWIVGFFAVFLSQYLILMVWKDAKFGTIANFIILIICIISFGYYHFEKMTESEILRIINNNKKLNKIIVEDDLNDLPKPIQNWLKNSGIIGKNFINIAKIEQKALLKMKPDQNNWMEATATQYSTFEEPNFIWVVKVKMNEFLNALGRDKFIDGKGEMFIKLNSLLTVVDEKGEKLDEGTIQRYLGEMVWMPSLAFSKNIQWEEIDSTTVKATINYKGTSGSGIFYFNSNGDFIKFTALRYMGNEANTKKYEWVIQAEDYKTFEGIKVPSKLTATWKLKQIDWNWLKMEITNIKYN